MATFPQIDTPPQDEAEVLVNEALETLEHQATYGKDPATTTGLTWGYYGGRWGGFSVAAGTFTLANNTSTYIVAAVASGVTSQSTSNTNWNNTTDYKRVYKVTTASGAVTVIEDHRGGPGGVHGSGGGSAGSLAADTDGTLAANSDSNVATQKATKTYVDNKVAGLSWKQAVRAASTANGTLATAFENGDTLDGVSLVTGDRILLKDQSSGAENGIYVVAASGAPSRSTDADTGAELVNATVYVSEGTANADTQWTCTTNATITPGSTSLTFARTGAGLGDASTNTSSSVDSEIALFSSTGGKTLKRATGTGTPYVTSGVYSIGKVTLTQPATGSTVTVLDGKTLEVDNTLTFVGTDSTTMTFPPASASIGYLGIPQNSRSAAYTTVLGDAGKHIYHPASDANARTFTIDSNANVAYPIGTAITFTNRTAQVLSIAITSDTMTLAGTTTTGTRSLAQNGVATALKVETTEWIISGTGLT